jgi:hypothetical protein
MNLKLVSCEIFYRELCFALARSPHRIDVEFLPKGLHDLESAEMRSRVQAVIDAVDPAGYDAVLLGYGLCNNGLAGVKARTLPLILPRAHDCISLFLGSRRRYREYFDSHPGTYFLTSGWIERGETSGGLEELSVQQQMGMNLTLQELAEQYGEENAEYLYETLCQGTRNYGRFAWIPMGVEPSALEAEARSRATERGWDFECVPGDMSLLLKLVGGEWDDADFLRVEPGGEIRQAYNEEIVRVRRAAD